MWCKKEETSFETSYTTYKLMSCFFCFLFVAYLIGVRLTGQHRVPHPVWTLRNPGMSALSVRTLQGKWCLIRVDMPCAVKRVRAELENVFCAESQFYQELRFVHVQDSRCFMKLKLFFVTRLKNVWFVLTREPP